MTGATGYIGGRLVPELLEVGHAVRVFVRSPGKLADREWADAVEVVRGDVLDVEAVRGAVADVDVVYYLVHSMGGDGVFQERDRRAAVNVRDAAADANVERIVYLGGLGTDSDDLSEHLRSRHEVGRVLADGPVPVTELRAAIIIGSGSASFEMLRHLVERLPVMVTPRWVRTRCQPIAIRDVLFYLVAALEHSDTSGEILEIGGPDVLTYEEMMQTYARAAGLRRRLIIPVPVLSPRLSSLWIGLVTPLPPGLGRPLVGSLANEVVVRDRPVSRFIPHETLPFAEALERALQRVQDLDVKTRWTDAELPGRTPADPLPTDPDWAGGTVLRDEQVVRVDAPPSAVFAVVEGIGGARGYYSPPWLWDARGFLDQLVGGVGMRRARRHPDRLRVGEPLDFWRVEMLEADRLLRLRAEMRLPGQAWLEWRVEQDGVGTVLRQTAMFHPRGLFGRLYWFALLPFHGVIFGRMARGIGRAAEGRGGHDGEHV